MAITSKTKPTAPKQKQYSFYLPQELFSAISQFVDRHRNAPESMTINGFARTALSRELARVKKAETAR